MSSLFTQSGTGTCLRVLQVIGSKKRQSSGLDEMTERGL